MLVRWGGLQTLKRKLKEPVAILRVGIVLLWETLLYLLLRLWVIAAGREKKRKKS